MSKQIQDFWAECCRALPDLPEATAYTVKSYGNSEELADRLLALIKDGDKTGTFALAWEFEQDPEAAPRQGDYVVVLDGRGEPGCLYLIYSIEILPFNQITEEHVACEGPAMRKLEPWQKMHWAFWTQILEGTEHSPAQDMTVIVQRFSVLYPAVTTSS